MSTVCGTDCICIEAQNIHVVVIDPIHKCLPIHIVKLLCMRSNLPHKTHNYERKIILNYQLKNHVSQANLLPKEFLIGSHL